MTFESASPGTSTPIQKLSVPKSTLRAVFQAVEIGLLNLEDLLSRAASDLDRRQFGAAAVKMSWACGFHRVLVKLSVLPQQLALIGDSEENRTRIGRMERIATDLIRASP